MSFNDNWNTCEEREKPYYSHSESILSGSIRFMLSHRASSKLCNSCTFTRLLQSAIKLIHDRLQKNCVRSPVSLLLLMERDSSWTKMLSCVMPLQESILIFAVFDGFDE
jgi:hypothetical protein